MYVCICKYLCIYVGLCLNVGMHPCVCIHTYLLYVYMRVVRLYVCKCVLEYVCIHMYICSEVCMHVCRSYILIWAARSTRSSFSIQTNAYSSEGFVLVCHSSGEKQYKFEEILPHYKEASNDTDCGTFADFMEALKTFDREGQGFINAAELRHILTMMGRHFKTI